MTTRIGTDGPQAPCIYLIDSPEHPTPLEQVAEGLRCSVTRIPVDDWGATLTPWPATALYRGEPDYAGRADQTLEWLLTEAIPRSEGAAGIAPRARAIAGYSLAGLFSLYAWLREQSLAAVACLSGSLWYEGWLEYMTKQMESTDFPATGRYAYLSLGSKERRGSRPQLKAVQDRTEACVELLRTQGLPCDYVLNPGGHLTRINERTRAGLLALDSFLTK